MKKKRTTKIALSAVIARSKEPEKKHISIARPV
jgi:hypothetical protein